MDYTWRLAQARWEKALEDAIRQPMVMGETIPVPPQHGGGLLDRMGIPAACVDAIRRLRRAIAGPAVAPGGEEWPLYQRHHSQSRLDDVRTALRDWDCAEACK